MSFLTDGQIINTIESINTNKYKKALKDFFNEKFAKLKEEKILPVYVVWYLTLLKGGLSKTLQSIDESEELYREVYKTLQKHLAKDKNINYYLPLLER